MDVRSAVDSSYGFKDVLAVLQQIDGGRILEEKYQTEVNAFVDSIISQFELQIKLTLSDKKDFDEMLDKLSDKKREAVAQLEAKSASAQPIDGSVDDIITDVRQALMRNSQRLAVLALNSNGNTSNFEGEVISQSCRRRRSARLRLSRRWKLSTPPLQSLKRRK